MIEWLVEWLEGRQVSMMMARGSNVHSPAQQDFPSCPVIKQRNTCVICFLIPLFLHATGHLPYLQLLSPPPPIPFRWILSFLHRLWKFGSWCLVLGNSSLLPCGQDSCTRLARVCFELFLWFGGCVPMAFLCALALEFAFAFACGVYHFLLLLYKHLGRDGTAREWFGRP